MEFTYNFLFQKKLKKTDVNPTRSQLDIDAKQFKALENVLIPRDKEFLNSGQYFPIVVEDYPFSHRLWFFLCRKIAKKGIEASLMGGWGKFVKDNKLVENMSVSFEWCQELYRMRVLSFEEWVNDLFGEVEADEAHANTHEIVGGEKGLGTNANVADFDWEEMVKELQGEGVDCTIQGPAPGVIAAEGAGAGPGVPQADEGHIITVGNSHDVVRIEEGFEFNASFSDFDWEQMADATPRVIGPAADEGAGAGAGPRPGVPQAQEELRRLQSDEVGGKSS